MTLDFNEANERLLLMLDAAPIAIGFFDRNFNLVDCNQKSVDMFGFYDKQDYMENLYILMPPAQSDGKPSEELFRQAVAAAYEDGKSRLADFVRQRLDGILIPTETVFVRVRHKDDYVVMSYTRDMTEVNQARVKEREANAMTKLMLDATPLACFLLRNKTRDDEITVMDCNTSARNLFGFYSKSEAILRYKDIYVDGKLPKDLDFVMKSGYEQFEWEHKSMDGRIFPCEVTLVRLDHQGEAVVAAYYQDLSPVKAMAAKMSRVDEAEEESRAKTQFLARMSHEIRTPLNAIMGLASIQLTKDNHSLEVEDAFASIFASSQTLLGIINDILDLSRIGSGKMKIIPDLYDTTELIAESARTNLMYLGSKSLDFVLEVNEKIPTKLVGDEVRIKQILNNLLSNAFKYTKEGCVILSFWVDPPDSELIALSEDEVSLAFSITDTGTGMTESQKNSLFSGEYIRYNENVNRYIEGTGLGMSIAHQLVLLMGGSITVESEEGEGSSFTVRIPQKQHGDTLLGAVRAEKLRKLDFETRGADEHNKIIYEPMPYGRVLVVDDTESNRYVAKEFLAPYEIAVETVESGYAAVEKVQNGERYDIIFMDHMMPGMDGIEATKIIRKLGYNDSIVALTANAVYGQAELFINSGFDGFISKPIDRHRFNAFLIRLIRDKHPAEVVEAAKRNVDYVAQEGFSPGLVEAFSRDAKNTIVSLTTLLDNPMGKESLRSYTIITHSIKSALANIGANKLSDIAKALEYAGRSADLNMIMNETKPFLKRLEELALSFASDRILEGVEDTAFFVKKLREFQIFCRKYETRGAKRILDELRRKPSSQQTRAIIEDLSAYILHSDFDLAAELAEKAEKSYS